MREIVEKMAKYHRLSWLCMAGMAVLLATTVLLYFSLDIRKAWRILSVRREKREIRRLEEIAAEECDREEKTELLTQEKKKKHFRKGKKSVSIILLCVVLLSLKAEAYPLGTGNGESEEKECEEDQQPPELSVKMENQGREKRGCIFFAGAGGQTEVVKMKLFEESYEKQTDKDGNPVRPRICILKDGKELSQVETDTLIRWEEFQNGELLVSAELPYEEAEETGYRICVSYRDIAGNPLKTAEDSFFLEEETTEEGTFRSKELVLDARAPGLTAYRMEGGVNAFVKTEEGSVPVYENRMGTDIEAIFTIEDREDFWDRGEVELLLRDAQTEETVKVLKGSDAAVRWKDEGNLHTAACSFEAEEGKEAVFQIEIVYRDAVGFSLKDVREDKTDGGYLEETEDGACYKSSAFILDAKRPEVSVVYPDAVNTVREGKESTAGYTAYYNGDIDIAVMIRERFPETEESEALFPTGTRVDLLWTENGKETLTQEITGDIQWERTGEDGLTGGLKIRKEGEGRLRIFYRDAAGNLASLEGENLDGNLEEGCEGPLLVIDKTAPRLSLSYGGSPVQRKGERLYFGKDTDLRVTVEDENFRVQELFEALSRFKAEDSEGKDLRENTSFYSFLEGLERDRLVRGAFSVQLPLDTEANYRIPVGEVTDLAGNTAVWEKGEEEQGAAGEFEACVTVDKTAPENLSISCPEAEYVNYLPCGWFFSQKEIKLSAEAEDRTAGLRMACFRMTEEDGTVKESFHFFEESESAKGSFQTEELGIDFKGVLQVELYDWAGNCSVLTRNCVTESENKHRQTGKAEIVTETEPGRIVDGTAYYREDVRFRIRIADAWSGIGKVRYEGGKTFRLERDYMKEAGTNLEEEAFGELLWETEEEVVLPARENNENDTAVRVFYTDHAGHTGFAEQRCHIDVAAPEITVEYEGEALAEGRYCSGERTAVVTVRERNFREEDVEFHITNTEGEMPQIGSWSSSGSGDNTKHVCRVVFTEDGDYTFTVGFQDLAGNRAAYERIDSFTIDRTAPELKIVWEGGKAENGHYFAEERIAVLEINEHNFREPRIYVEEEREGKKEKRKLQAVWKRNGDSCTARLVFHEEGMFRLETEGEDLAGNMMQAYDSGEFVIDRTPPQLEITGVRDKSANKGEVCPVICFHDRNLDWTEKEIRLQGGRNRNPQLKGRENILEDGVEILYEDFPYLPSSDDLYTLEAEVRDLAGNISRTDIAFSVNRFGSVYTFGAVSEALVGKNGNYYTDREQDLVVTETNVDTLEFREITCSRDGSLETLEEGRDYTVREERSKEGWKQYTYTIGKENFEKEGIYLLTLYSEDKAGNSSDNSVKGKRIEFGVDKTPPEILLSGVKEKGQYREREKRIVLDVQDNLCLKEVRILMDGKEKRYSGRDLETSDGQIILEAGSAGHWQELKVWAFDAAGHSTETEPVHFLVTPNLFLQIVLNKTWLCAGSLMILSLAAGSVGLMRLKKRKERMQKKNGSQ